MIGKDDGLDISCFNASMSRRDALKFGFGAASAAILSSPFISMLMEPREASAVAFPSQIHFAYGVDYGQGDALSGQEHWTIVEYPTGRENYHGHVQCFDSYKPGHGTNTPYPNTLKRWYDMSLNLAQHHWIRALCFFCPGGPGYNPNDTTYWGIYAGLNNYNKQFELVHEALSYVANGFWSHNFEGRLEFWEAANNIQFHAKERLNRNWVWSEDQFDVRYMNLHDANGNLETQRHVFWITGGSKIRVIKRVRDGEAEDLNRTYTLKVTVRDAHNTPYTGWIGNGKGDGRWVQPEMTVNIRPNDESFVIGYMPAGWNVLVEEVLSVEDRRKYTVSYNEYCNGLCIQEPNYPYGKTYDAVVYNDPRRIGLTLKKVVENVDAVIDGVPLSQWRFRFIVTIMDIHGNQIRELPNSRDPEHPFTEQAPMGIGNYIVMSANETLVFDNLSAGLNYRILEESVSKDGGNTWIPVESATAYWCPVQWTIDGELKNTIENYISGRTTTESTVICTNKEVVPTKLDIHKEVIDSNNLLSDPSDRPPTTEFLVHLVIKNSNGTEYTSDDVTFKRYTGDINSLPSDSSSSWETLPASFVNRQVNDYRFNIKHNETIRVGNLPSGGTWDVYEEALSAYWSEVVPGSGTLEALASGENPALVTIRNNRIEGRVQLKKKEKETN